MANGIKLSDGRIINADHVALLSFLGGSNGSLGFTVEFSSGTKLFISGADDEVKTAHRDLRRAMGVADESLVR